MRSPQAWCSSTRRSGSCRSSRWPRTSSSAGSRARAGASTASACTTSPTRCSNSSAPTSTRTGRSGASRWPCSRRSRSPRRSPASRATSSSTSRRPRWAARETERVLDRIRVLRDQARASSTSRTASTRSARSPTASSACATAALAAGTPAACRRPTWSTRWWAASSPTSTRAPEPAHDHTVLERARARAGAASSRTSTSRWTRARCSASPGLVGAGRTETVRAIAGADRADTGDVLVDGKTVNARNPRRRDQSRAS